MKVIKYSTENLVCLLAKDKLGQEYYNIFEKSKMTEPVAIYIDKHNMKLSNDIPSNATEYKYFDEMSEIVTFLYNL